VSANPDSSREPRTAPPAATAPVGVRTRAVVSGPWAIVALAAMAMLAVVVFVLVPGWFAPPPELAQPATSTSGPTQAADARETVRQRLAAAEAQLRFEGNLKALRGRGAEMWARDDLAAATRAADAAAAAVTAGDYARGAQRYDEANRWLTGIAGRAESVYADALKRGETAIQAGDQAQATEAFRLAAAIHPDAPAAQAGVVRAARLEQVLAHMRSGAERAEAGDWDAARTAYAAASKLERAYAPAAEALARVERHLAKQRFAQLITRGLAHLDRAEWADAEQAFLSAARLRPGDQSAADGLARAREGQERSALAALRSEAQRLEAAERWNEALAAYRRAAAIDPALEFARQGIARTEKMAALRAELDALLADPKRLYSPEVRAQARQVLASVGSAPVAGPQLEHARQRLEAALRHATTPVAVRLASDDATDVTVYRFGSLGKFRSRDIELTPGTYTVVGSRAGYKDVRMELTVEPDAPATRLFVACKEPV
jgi:tetratricopeptide (TPR) repeat protein